MNLKDITSCPDCGSTNIIHGTLREQIICRDCGLIFEPLAHGLEEKMPLSKPAEVSKVKPVIPKKKAVKKAKGQQKKAMTKKSKQKEPAKKKAVRKKANTKVSGLKKFLKGLTKKRK